MHITRIATTAMGLFVAFALIGSAACMYACTAGQVRRKVAAVTEQAEQAIAAKTKLDQTIEALATLPEDEALAAVRAVLGPDQLAAFDRAIAGGKTAIHAARDVSAVFGASAQALLTQLETLKQDLATAEENDDATLKVVAAVLGGLHPIVAAVVGVFAVRHGERKGAQFVASTIAVGRGSDPALDQGFRSGPAHDAMSTMLDTKPRLAEVVRANKTV